MSTDQLATSEARQLLDADELQRTLWRLSRELQERHPEGGVVLIGILTRGAFLAVRLLELIRSQGGSNWTGSVLDVGPYRDDGARSSSPETPSLPLTPATTESVRDREVVLVDDVLFHGRTGRAALDALADLGRPRAVELLVVVDRGHRELPLRATYVGRNLPTSETERVLVRLREVDGKDAVLLRSDEVEPA
jgi:pyrimidine operon attenuation protein / uracil phosphoribosyltransferase